MIEIYIYITITGGREVTRKERIATTAAAAAAAITPKPDPLQLHMHVNVGGPYLFPPLFSPQNTPHTHT